MNKQNAKDLIPNNVYYVDWVGDKKCHILVSKNDLVEQEVSFSLFASDEGIITNDMPYAIFNKKIAVLYRLIPEIVFDVDKFKIWFIEAENKLFFEYEKPKELKNPNYTIQVCDLESHIVIYYFNMDMNHQYWAVPFNQITDQLFRNYKNDCTGYLIKIFQDDSLVETKELKFNKPSVISFPVKYNYYFKDYLSASYLDFMHNDIYGDFIKDCKIIVDAGANIGAFVQYAKIKNPDLEYILAIEPIPECYNYLNSNFSFSGFVPHQAALYSFSNQKIKLFKNDKHTTSTSIIKTVDNGIDEIEVDTISLEEICNEFLPGQRIDLLKMDIEGAEYAVIENTPVEILKKIDKIIMEYHYNEGSNNLGTIINKLTEAGFKFSEKPDFSDDGTIHPTRQGTFFVKRDI